MKFLTFPDVFPLLFECQLLCLFILSGRLFSSLCVTIKIPLITFLLILDYPLNLLHLGFTLSSIINIPSDAELLAYFLRQQFLLFDSFLVF